jgi:type I restriction enzyme S subunit
LYWDEFKNLCLALPPFDEQIEIVRNVASEIDKFATLAEQAARGISLLQERRAALIAAAVTGKIDVRGLVDASEAA